MLRRLLCSSAFFLSAIGLHAQTGIGIGLYPTGTETGFGIRSSKETRFAGDARVTRANVFNDKTKISSFVTELSLIYRVVKLERVRFHVGLGYKADWNLHESNKHGVIVPVGVEAFPFPFQNAGLFFEAAPFYVYDFKSRDNAGSGQQPVSSSIFLSKYKHQIPLPNSAYEKY